MNKRIPFRRKEVDVNFNVDKLIKSKPLYVYLTAIVIGFTSAFSVMAYGKTFLNLEIEKKGTYLYFSDYWNNINSNFIQKEVYNNVVIENEKLKELVEKYRSKNTDTIMVEINKLKIERDHKTADLIEYTSSMSVSLDGNNRSINTDTEKYKTLKAELEQINKSLSILYERL